jgi:hypothetical protein
MKHELWTSELNDCFPNISDGIPLIINKPNLRRPRHTHFSQKWYHVATFVVIMCFLMPNKNIIN